MDNQTAITEIGAIFAKWQAINAHLDTPEGLALSEPEYESLNGEAWALVEACKDLSPATISDVWAKVCMLLEQPTEQMNGSEVLVARMARVALGLSANLPNH